jgi:hypothetical protein
MPDSYERRIIAIALIGALFYVLIFKEGATGSFMNLMFVMVGYYFGNGNRQLVGADR